MAKSTLILRHLLPFEAVSIGSLVLDIRHPEQEFFPPEPGSIPESDTITQRLSNFRYVIDQTKGSGLHAYLTAFFSASSSNTRASTINISSASCITRQLKNPGTVFEQMCESQRARAWLERAMRGRKSVYVVSGIQSLIDTQVHESDKSTVQNEANMPATLAMALRTRVAIPGGKALDFGAGVQGREERDENMKFDVKEEQIFAVQYRKVAFRSFKRREVDDAYLKLASCWRIYLGGRGGEEEDEGDVVDVKVEEYLKPEDIKHKFCETVGVDGEKVLYLV